MMIPQVKDDLQSLLNNPDARKRLLHLQTYACHSLQEEITEISLSKQ